MLLIVDMQERLLPAIAGSSTVAANAGNLIDASARLDVPVVASEQYINGLGDTVAALRRRLPTEARIEKMTFDATREPAIRERLRARDRPQVLLAGTEAHVCVLQTALGCRSLGLEVFVAGDAVGSRDPAERDLALDRLRHAGITVISTEMAIFEWLERAGTDAFRDLLPTIK
jgi:nicotinamidase-related amidase